MGRLIPAGTGMEYYRNVKVERDETITQGRHDRDMEDFPEITGGMDVPTPSTTRAAVVAAIGDGETVEEEPEGDE